MQNFTSDNINTQLLYTRALCLLSHLIYICTQFLYANMQSQFNKLLLYANNFEIKMCKVLRQDLHNYI